MPRVDGPPETTSKPQGGKEIKEKSNKEIREKSDNVVRNSLENLNELQSEKIYEEILAASAAIDKVALMPAKGQTESAFVKALAAHEQNLRAAGKMTHEDWVIRRYDLIAQLMKVDANFAHEKFPIECADIKAGTIPKKRKTSKSYKK